MAKKKVNTQPFWRFLFLVYLALMLWLLFGRTYNWVDGLTYQEMIARNINAKPFYTIDNYLYVVLHRPQSGIFLHCLINLVGNVVMFIPAGWLLPRIFPRFRRFWKFLLCCAVSILLIEVFQLFTLLGSFDVDDIILNLIGMILGYLAWQIFRRR